MRSLKLIAVAGALLAVTAGSALAQGSASRKSVMDALNVKSSSYLAQRDGPYETAFENYLSLRLGAMVAPRGGFVAGADVLLPTLGLTPSLTGRLDADVIFEADFDGVDTIIPVTFNQIWTSPGDYSGRSFYVGAGVGVILGGPGVFDFKLIGGAEITDRLGVEANIHFTDEDTIVTLMARLHL